MIVTLPWPPSANTYYRRHGKIMHISNDGQQYRKDVRKCISKRLLLRGRIKVEIVANPPDKRKRDIDNIIKPLLDSLTKAGVWLDDSQIDHLEVIRTQELSGSVTVMVDEMEQLT